MTKRYFVYLLKSSRWMIMILTIIGLILYIPTLASAPIDVNTQMMFNPELGTITFFLAAACTLVPIYEFTYMKRKRNLDSIYSFPIRRHEIAALKFIIGFIEIIIPYTICFFLGFAVVASRSPGFNLVYYFSFYGTSLAFGLILYSFYTFVYTRANTVIDGIVLMLLYTFVFMVIFSTFIEHLDNYRSFFTYGISFSPLVELTGIHTALIQGYPREPLQAGPYIFWGLIGIGSIAGLILSTFTDKAERAEQLSDSWFSYKVLIPLFIISLLNTTINAMFGTVNIALLGSYVAAGVVGYIIYQRKFKFEGKYWLYLAGSILAGILFSYII